MAATIKKAVGEAGAFLDSSNTRGATLRDILAELATNQNLCIDAINALIAADGATTVGISVVPTANKLTVE